MNRYTLHQPGQPRKYTEVKIGQTWEWKESPGDFSYFIKIYRPIPNGWLLTSNEDISEEELLKEYKLYE